MQHDRLCGKYGRPTYFTNSAGRNANDRESGGPLQDLFVIILTNVILICITCLITYDVMTYGVMPALMPTP